MPGRPSVLLAKARGQNGQGLPIRKHAVDRLAAQPRRHTLNDVVLVEDARHLQVVVHALLQERAERLAGRVGDAIDLGAHLGEAAGVLNHFGWKSWCEEYDAH
jgi:hypothetical protein